MNITYVGEITSIIKTGGNKYKSCVDWKTSFEKYASNESVYLPFRLELGSKVFVNFRTEDDDYEKVFAGLESENNQVNPTPPQPVAVEDVTDTQNEKPKGYFEEKLDNALGKV